jgi:phosphatidate cytidylyltransferase
VSDELIAMLKTRILTALVLLLVFVPVTIYAPLWGFGALVGVVVMCAAWEWARLLKIHAMGATCYAGVVAVAIVIVARFWRDAPALYEVASVFWVVVGPYVLMRRPALAAGAWRVFLLAAGLMVFAACWRALLDARQISVAFVLSLLLVVWLADIGAYFAGKAFGRHKLAPAISPGKTWEGAAGGWALGMVVAAAALAWHVFEPTLYSCLAARWGVGRALVMLTVLVALSVMGDLFESTLKRQAGMKDSGTLLPGHGGVFDRIDALLPVLPLAMLLAGH